MAPTVVTYSISPLSCQISLEAFAPEDVRDFIDFLESQHQLRNLEITHHVYRSLRVNVLQDSNLRPFTSLRSLSIQYDRELGGQKFYSLLLAKSPGLESLEIMPLTEEVITDDSTGLSALQEIFQLYSESSGFPMQVKLKSLRLVDLDLIGWQNYFPKFLHARSLESLAVTHCQHAESLIASLGLGDNLKELKYTPSWLRYLDHNLPLPYNDLMADVQEIVANARITRLEITSVGGPVLLSPITLRDTGHRLTVLRVVCSHYGSIGLHDEKDIQALRTYCPNLEIFDVTFAFPTVLNDDGVNNRLLLLVDVNDGKFEAYMRCLHHCATLKNLKVLCMASLPPEDSRLLFWEAKYQLHFPQALPKTGIFARHFSPIVNVEYLRKIHFEESIQALHVSKVLKPIRSVTESPNNSIAANLMLGDLTDPVCGSHAKDEDDDRIQETSEYWDSDSEKGAEIKTELRRHRENVEYDD